MTLQQVYNFFKSLKNDTDKDSEIKIYDQFLYIINALEHRNFSKEELQSIETKLDRLNLKMKPDNRKKYFKKALSLFESYLKDTFSLTSKLYYTILGVVFGPTFGVVLGVIMGNQFERSLGISIGISIGLLFGLFVGQYMDAQAKAHGRML